jgi:hypothetical protein
MPEAGLPVNLVPAQLTRMSQLSNQWSFLWDKRRSLWIAAEDCPDGEQIEEADLDMLLAQLPLKLWVGDQRNRVARCQDTRCAGGWRVAPQRRPSMKTATMCWLCPGPRPGTGWDS